MAAPDLRADQLVEHTTQAAVEEKAKLQKHFGRFDIFFFLICTLVGLDTPGAVSNDGAQAFTWLAFLGVFLTRWRGVVPAPRRGPSRALCA